jgi:hypothetical protein
MVNKFLSQSSFGMASAELWRFHADDIHGYTDTKRSPDARAQFSFSTRSFCWLFARVILRGSRNSTSEQQVNRVDTPSLMTVGNAYEPGSVGTPSVRRNPEIRVRPAP